MAWITKNAITIVKIIGIIANLYKKPIIKAIEHANSAKTGSAEAAGNKVHAWFVGFAPFENPEIAIVVMVENGGHGNYTAEVVRDIMAEYFGMNTQNVEEDMSATPYVQILN